MAEENDRETVKIPIGGERYDTLDDVDIWIGPKPACDVISEPVSQPRFRCGKHLHQIDVLLHEVNSGERLS